MTCPHRGANESCAIAPYARITDYGCSICQAEWTNGPPTADAPTPTLQALVQINQPDWNESQPSRGLGDTVSKFAKLLGIRPRRGCGCGRRRAWLNRLVPYRP